MKLISLSIFTIIAGLTIFIIAKTITFDGLLFYFPCDHPVTYHLGTIDPRFNLSPAEAQNDIVQATSLWDSEYEKILFKEDQQSKLTVNFVYDERQGLINEINTIEDKTNNDKTTLDSKINSFNQRSKAFDQKIKNLNEEIESWNQKGGAPPNVYDDLISRQRALSAEGQKLEIEANSLNQSTNNFNQQVAKLNGTITNFNTLLSQKPEEGIFDPKSNTIDIYFNNSKNELIHTLAHEFGHSLGIEHVEDTDAIMYSYTSESVKLSEDDINSLQTACKRINKIEYLVERLKKLTHPDSSTLTE